jgi:nitronate monooxygenase
MWLRTDLLDLLGIEHPIIQAPMSSVTTPALAAAVSNAGALGSLGSGSLSAAAIREQVAATRQVTNRSLNINFSPTAALRCKRKRGTDADPPAAVL